MRVAAIHIARRRADHLMVGRFESDFEILKRKGTLVSVGNASGAVPPFAPLKLVTKNLRLVRPSSVPFINLLFHMRAQIEFT